MGARTYDGRTCDDCGTARGLLVICKWAPARTVHDTFYGREITHPAWLRKRAICLDRTACLARVRKRSERQQVRASVIVLEEPVAPLAPSGWCRWCGEELTGKNASRRNYCRRDREGRDCVGEWNRSRVWSARDAVRWRDLRERGEVRCEDCDALCESKTPTRERKVGWEADHEVALEDDGEHTLDNLRARCDRCHRRKTARENAARAARRRAALPEPDTGQLALAIAQDT